ncbi:MAG: D-alanine--D-alanine ligase [Lachnospiraceae bacterium]|nr:D-alanine--D-alanine ligase [Lachnospiraceae bacterium]
MKIVVLAGGTSTERDVSIVSGTKVCQALQERGHQAVLLDVFFGWAEADPSGAFQEPQNAEQAAEYMKSFNDRLEEEVKGRKEFFGPKVLELCRAADVVFMALHGANGEDGRVQAAFDLFGIPYTGTGYLSSAVSMDKAITKQFFRAHSIPTPQGISLTREDARESAKDLGLEFPVVVKPCCGGSSVGVEIARNEEEFQKALDQAFFYENQVVIEEYISGREFSVGVVDGEAYPVIEIAPKEGFYDYRNKYLPGSTVETCPADLTPEQTKEMQRYAAAGAEVLGITGYCRLDFMMREDGRMYCLEANTLPGMTPTSLLPQEAAALGISFGELCENLIRISLEKYRS